MHNHNRFSHVQYGCGFSAPKTWLNFDASPTLRFERLPFIGKLYSKNKNRFPLNVEYGNIVNGLPVPDAVCKVVYASHILEHLALNDFRLALINTFRIMQSGGIFRLVVPDLRVYTKKYLENSGPDASLEFMVKTCLGISDRPRSIAEWLVAVFGNSHHLWMWDYGSLVKELTTAGFIEVHRVEYGDSIDPLFLDVEDEGRFIDAVAIECKKH